MNNIEKFIVLVNNDCIKKSDAIVLLEGDGYSRVDKAAELYHMKYSDKVIFSGGFDDPKSGAFNHYKVLPKMIECGIKEKDIIIEDNSKNTRQQGEEIMKMIKENNWKRILLVASGFHQYRAYLTFLKCMKDLNMLIEIINAPETNLKWYEENSWGKRIDLLDLEFKKIEEYSKKGHLFNYDEVFEYQKWKELQ